jgi:hypothetical protein
MTVTSKEVRADDHDDLRGAALFSRKRLARQQTGFERFAAALLILISFVGSVLFGGGGVGAWRQLAPLWWGAGAALAIQGLCTWSQWIYSLQSWRSWKYDLAVVVSTGMTLAGFWGLLHPPLTTLLASWQVPAANAPYFAGGLLALVAGAIDIYPEKSLTK